MIREVLSYYFITSVVSFSVFLTTAIILYKKYLKKNLNLIKWAAVAFFFLALQEIVVIYWLVDSLTTGYLISLRPWHLQVIALFFSFNLLGLSMIGKIED